MSPYVVGPICDLTIAWYMHQRAVKKRWRQGNENTKQVESAYVKRPERREKRRAWVRKHYASKGEEARIKAREYYQKNKEKKREYHRAYRAKHREKFNALSRESGRHLDIHYRIKRNISQRIRIALFKGKGAKSKRTFELIGCSIPQLKEFLQAKFLPGMTWENYGSIWEIDHIIPCSNFDLKISEEQEKCFNHANLQPLWVWVNRSKGTKKLEDVDQEIAEKTKAPMVKVRIKNTTVWCDPETKALISR